MREHDLILEDANCERYQSLIEAGLVDEVELSDVDRAFVISHEKSCPECQLYADMLGAMENLESGDAQVDDSIVNAVETVFTRRRSSRLKWLGLGAAAAAMIAGLVILLTALNQPQATGPMFRLASGTILHDGETFGVGNSVHLSPTVATPNAENALLQVPDNLYLALEQNAQLRVVHSDDDLLHIALDAGRMAVYLVPDGLLDLFVSLPWGTVEVTGTVFVVDASRNTGHVEVVRGSVAVEQHDEKQTLKAGWRLGTATGETSKRRIGSADPLLSLLGIHEKIQPVVELAAKDNEVEVHPVEPENTVRPSPVKPTLEELLREARGCRLEKNWQCAVSKYKKAATLYSGRPAAATAMVSAGQILLENMHQPGESLTLFRKYQKRRPTGGLGREALFGECSSLKALNRVSQEKKCLSEYLKKYPGTVYSKMAQTRLSQMAAP